MKQMEVTEKRIGEYTFYIKPFPAFVAANMSGELASIIAPLLGGFAGMLGGSNNEEQDGKQEVNIFDMDVEKALPSISAAFSNISGDKFEMLMRKLLVLHSNISVEGEATNGDVKVMSYDLANEIFCGEVQDMYILCFHVIKLNFNGFFKKFGTLSGNLLGNLQMKVPGSANGDTLMQANSQNSN